MKIFIIIVAIYLALVYISKCLEVEKLKAEIKRIERSADRWEDHYMERIQSLENENDKLWKAKARSKPNVSTDIIKAVKYATKRSHPDNGGNADDFIRFQKVYEELTRK